MFTISQLLEYKDITIQCHDNPDADALASAFAVQRYLAWKNIPARIIYAGRQAITKSNLVEMLEKCSISAEFVPEPVDLDTLVVVDGQYGAGNVTKCPAKTVCVIDHHREEKTDFNLGVIDPLLGSCSTLLWCLLTAEGYALEEDKSLSTALYYGLYTDTNSLAEISHPLDKDMRDTLLFSKSIIKRLQNSNLTFTELNIAGDALSTFKSDRLGYAIFKAEPCDPNILGFISDIALQVDSVDACVVYNLTGDGAKLSIRSCIREIMASEFAAFLAEGIGSGGGHRDKAGGFISQTGAESLGMTLDECIAKRTHAYFDSYDTVDAAAHTIAPTSMARFRKRPVPVGFVESTAVFPPGTPLLIRALEGDEEAVASEEIYLMVGILGEVYPIKAEKFRRSYRVTDEQPLRQYSYTPTLRDRATGETKALDPYIKGCISLGETFVYAAPLTKNTKVFTAWNADGYMFGKPGDWIAFRAEDVHDVYIIREDIFGMTYDAE